MPTYMRGRAMQLAKRMSSILSSIYIKLTYFRFVVATRRDALNNRSPVFLRSYKHPHESHGLRNVKVWQAARATSAAPTYFSSMKLGDYELVDGGLSANNPLGW